MTMGLRLCLRSVCMTAASRGYPESSGSVWARSPVTTCGSLVADMTRIIPQANHRLGQVVFVTQGTDARRAQEEVSTGSRFEPQPSSRKHAQEMPAGKEQHVPLKGPHSAYHAVGPDTNL